MEYNPNMYDKTAECGKIYSELLELNNKIGKSSEDKYQLYNSLERFILFENNDEVEKSLKSIAMEFLNKIKILSMNLQRVKASDWNYFIDLAMNPDEGT